MLTLFANSFLKGPHSEGSCKSDFRISKVVLRVSTVSCHCPFVCLSVHSIEVAERLNEWVRCNVHAPDTVCTVSQTVFTANKLTDINKQ